jgi:hypothetical protein
MSELIPGPALDGKQVLFANHFIEGNAAELFAALSKAQNEFKVAVFDKKAVYGPYASFKSVREASIAALSANGLSVLQPVVNDGTQYRLFTILAHSSGAFIKTSIVLILDKNNMQGLGSAITYAKRYAWSAMVGVVSDDDDDAFVAAPNPQIKTPPVDKIKKEPPNVARSSEDEINLLYSLAMERGISERLLSNLISVGYGSKSRYPAKWIVEKVAKFLENEDANSELIEKETEFVRIKREAAAKERAEQVKK